ncbi:unnamed protein product, partial [marine sediment metagenome]
DNVTAHCMSDTAEGGREDDLEYICTYSHK